MIRNLRNLLISYWSKHYSKKIKLRKSKLLIYDEYLKKYVSADELLVPAKTQQIKTVVSADKTDVLIGMLMKKFVNPALDILTPGACNNDLKKFSDLGINQRYSTLNLFWKKKNKINKHKHPALQPVHEEMNDITHATGVGWAGQATQMTMREPRPEHGKGSGCPGSQHTDHRQSLTVCREDKQAPSPQQDSQYIKSILFEKDKEHNTNGLTPPQHETNNYVNSNEPSEEKQKEKPQCSDFEIFPQKLVEKENNIFSSICTTFQSFLMSEKKSDSLPSPEKENMKIKDEICTMANYEDQIKIENTKSEMHNTPYEDPKGDETIKNYTSPECQNIRDKTKAVSNPQPSVKSGIFEVKIKSIEKVNETDNMCRVSPDSDVKIYSYENQCCNTQTENTSDVVMSDKCLTTESNNNMAINKCCTTKTSQITFKNDATSFENLNLKSMQIMKTNVSELKERVSSLSNNTDLKSVCVNMPLQKDKECSSNKNMACTSENVGKNNEMSNTPQHIDSRDSHTMQALYQQTSVDEMNMATDLSKYKYDTYMGFKIQKPSSKKIELKGKTKSKTKIRLKNLNKNQSRAIAASPNKTSTDIISIDKTSAEATDTNKQDLSIKSAEPFTQFEQDVTIQPICQKKTNEPASTLNPSTGPADQETRQWSKLSKDAEIHEQNEMFKTANNGNEKENVKKYSSDIKLTLEGHTRNKNTLMTTNTLEFPDQFESDNKASTNMYSKYITNGGFKKENLANVRTEYNIPTGVDTRRSRTFYKKFNKVSLKQLLKTSNVNKSALKIKDQKKDKTYSVKAFNRSVKISSRKKSAPILLNKKIINKSKDLIAVKRYTEKPRNKDIKNSFKRNTSAIIHSDREIINKPNKSNIKGKLQIINKGTEWTNKKPNSTKLTKYEYKNLPSLNTSKHRTSGTTLNFKSKVNTGGRKTYSKTDIQDKPVQNTSLDDPQNINIINKKYAPQESLIESKSAQLYPYNTLQHEVFVNPLPCKKKVKLKTDTAIKFKQTSNSIGNTATKMSSQTKKSNTKSENDNVHILFQNHKSYVFNNIKGGQAHCEEEALKPTSKPFSLQLTQHELQGKQKSLFLKKPNIKLLSKSLPRHMNENLYLGVNNENNKSINNMKVIGVPGEGTKSLYSIKGKASTGRDVAELHKKNNNSNHTLNSAKIKKNGIGYNFKKVTIIKTNTHKNKKRTSDINEERTSDINEVNPIRDVKSVLVKNKKILHKTKELEDLNGFQKSFRNMPNELVRSNKIGGIAKSGNIVNSINIKKSKSMIYTKKHSLIQYERPKTSEALDKRNANQKDIKTFTSGIQTTSVVNNKTKPVGNNNKINSLVKTNITEMYNVKEFKKLADETHKIQCTNNLKDCNNIENKTLFNDNKLIQHFKKAVDKHQKRQNTEQNNIQRSSNILPTINTTITSKINIKTGKVTNSNINKLTNKNKINNNSEEHPPVTPNTTNISADQVILKINESLNSHTTYNVDNSKQRNGFQFKPITKNLNNELLKDNKIDNFVLKRIVETKKLKNIANNEPHNMKMCENKLTETKDTIPDKNQRPAGKPEFSFCNETPTQNNVKFNLMDAKTSKENNRIKVKNTKALGNNSIKREDNNLTSGETKKTINSRSEYHKPNQSNEVYFNTKSIPNNVKAVSKGVKMVKENNTFKNMNINMIKNVSIEKQKSILNNKSLTGIKNVLVKSPQISLDKISLDNLAHESKTEINVNPHEAKPNSLNSLNKHETIKSIETKDIISNKNALLTPKKIIPSDNSPRPATIVASPCKANKVKPKSQEDVVGQENFETLKKNYDNHDNKVIIKSTKVNNLQVKNVVTNPELPRKFFNQIQQNQLVGNVTKHNKIMENIPIKQSIKNTMNPSPINVIGLNNNTTIRIGKHNKITKPISTFKPFLNAKLKIENNNTASLSEHDIHNIVQDPNTNKKLQSNEYNLNNSIEGPENEIMGNVNAKKEINAVINQRIKKMLNKYPNLETYRLQQYKINAGNHKPVEDKSGCVEEKIKDKTNSDIEVEITNTQHNGEENKPLPNDLNLMNSKEQPTSELRNRTISHDKHAVKEKLNETSLKMFGQKPLTNNKTNTALTNNKSKVVVGKSNETKTSDVKQNVVYNKTENKPNHDRAQLKLNELTKRNSINTKAQVYVKDENYIKPPDKLLVNTNLLQRTKKSKECHVKNDRNKVITNVDTIQPNTIHNTDDNKSSLNSVQVTQNGLSKNTLINTKVQVINHHNTLDNHLNEQLLTNTKNTFKSNKDTNDINKQLNNLNESIRTSINRSIRSAMSPKAAIIDNTENTTAPSQKAK